MTIARDLANVASLMASSSANVVFDDSIVVTGGTANAFAYLDANKRLTTASIPPGGITYTYRTSNYTASNLDGVLTDTANGSFTVTLPATPSTGNYVVVADAGNSWGNNNLTVARNGSTIGGLAENLVCDITGARLEIVYDGTTWEVYAQVGGQGGNALAVNTRNANGVVYLDSSNVGTTNSSFVYTGTNLGVGTSTPQVRLVVSRNASNSLPTPPANSNFEVHGEDGAPNRITYYAYGGVGGGSANAPTFTFRRSNGTAASPTTLATNDALGVFGAQGYDGSAWTLNRSSILFYAANTWTTTSTPTNIQFITTPNGSNTPSVNMILSDAGNLGVGTNAPATRLHVVGGSLEVENASTQDAVIIAGRAGGTSSYTATITPTTLTANRTLTLPNETGTIATQSSIASKAIAMALIFGG